MVFEVRVPKVGKPGECHDFYSCDCGNVTSEKHEDAAAREMLRLELGKIQRRLDASFRAWATRNSETPKPGPKKDPALSAGS